MKKHTFHNAILLAALAVVYLSLPASADNLLAWGSNSADQVTDLPTEADYVAVAAGDAHGLALTSDGSVVAWGHNGHGQCDVPEGTFTAIGAGALFSLGIRDDGTIAAWGDDRLGQVSDAPAGNDFVAVDGGLHFAVALRKDGAIVAWGDDRNNQVSGTPKGSDFVAVAAGDAHAVALRSDGSLVAWGYTPAIAGKPTKGTFTAVSAGGDFCLALTELGQIVWWGDDAYELGLDEVPTGSDFVAIAAGYLHALAIRTDGSAVGWGAGTETSGTPDLGQANPPERDDYTALAGGLYFSLGLTETVDLAAASDNFDDNNPGIMWSLGGDDLANCYLDETNKRLELRATSKSDDSSAYYFSNGWGIDPTLDFSLRVDFRQDLKLGNSAWLSITLTPDADGTSSQRVEFGLGSNGLYSYYWVTALNGSKSFTKNGNRSRDNGTLYVSYSASRDELYLSYTGYGAENAWVTVQGYLRNGWGARMLNIGLSGGSDQRRVDSGQAYLDNFVVDAGNAAVTKASNVYRFWSAVTGTHFYTINEREKDRLIARYPDVWIFEGVVFKATTTPLSLGLNDIYRFWSDKTGSHFYTIDETEADKLLDDYADVWTFEGTAFYAYPEGRQPSDAIPVYRFWNVVTGAHFYTIDEKEKQKLIKDYPKTYTFEGVAFYAFE